MSTRSLAAAALAAAVLIGPPASLFAQGVSVEEQGACMTARVGAGVAAPCADGSAVFFSPGALATQRSVLGLGVAFIRSSNTFDYNAGLNPGPAHIERTPETIPVPHGYVNWRVRPRLALAAGLWAPYGLTLEWPVCAVSQPSCGSSNFEGRYTGYDNSLRGIYIQPTVSYQLVPDRLSVGAGVDIVRGSIDVHQRADAPQIGLFGVDVADAELKGSDWGFTGHVGALAKLGSRVSLGARYLHSAKLAIDGDATFRQVLTGVQAADTLVALQFKEGGPLKSRGVSTEIELPAQAVAGVAVQATSKLLLAADYQWTDWSSFDKFVLQFQRLGARTQAEDVNRRVLNLDFKNTSTYKLGAELAATPQLALRAGFRYNTGATPRATPFLPEGERNYYSLGLGYHFTPGLGADLFYQYVNQPDRRGAVRPDGPIAGVYTAKGQTFGVTLSYLFGPTK